MTLKYRLVIALSMPAGANNIVKTKIAAFVIK
jgi:hypothetical protein